MSVDYFVVAAKTNPPPKTPGTGYEPLAYCHPSVIIGDASCIDWAEFEKFDGRKIDEALITEVMAIRQLYDHNADEGRSAEEFLRKHIGEFLFVDGM